jgi:hypothetical protein
MNTQTVSNWFQIIASIAVLAGLALVLIELRQSKALAEAQFARDAFMFASQLDLTLMGDNPVDALKKACMEPAHVSETDAIILSLVLENLYQRVWSMKLSNELADFGAPWTATGVGDLRRILDTEFGRRWWIQSQDYRDPEIVELGNELLSKLGPPSCEARFHGLLE